MQLNEHTEKATEATQLPKANGNALLDPNYGIEGGSSPDPVAILHAQKSLVEHFCRLVAKEWIDSHGEKQKTDAAGERIGPSSIPKLR